MSNPFWSLITFFVVFSGNVEPQNVPGVCICVPIGTCNNQGNPGLPGNPGFPGFPPGNPGFPPGRGSDGSGQIDIRVQTNGNPSPSFTGTPLQIATAASSGINLIVQSVSVCQPGLERCCPPGGFMCGVRYPPVIGSRPIIPGSGQAQFGAYPWQAVVLAPGDIYQGSGVLIDQLNVLTVAHRVADFLTNGRPLKVRLGEWDAASSTEPIPAQEFPVARIFIHPQYTASNLRNDIAILRLGTPVQLGQVPTITTACLPSTQLTSIRCWVAGWGRNDFSNTGAFQAIQKEVDLPLIDSATCQNQLRATRLGQNFQLDFTSFICAGGEPGKDACTGDGGSPLICQIGANWFAAGLVAWGIGCGQTNVPGVYVNVASYISWIQSTTRS